MKKRRLGKARKPVTVRGYSWRLNLKLAAAFLIFQLALVSLGAATIDAMIGEPFFENGRFNYLAEIDTATGDVILRPPELADGSWETFAAWTSEARGTCTPFVYTFTIASDLPTAALVADSLYETYDAWARAQGLPIGHESRMAALKDRVGSHLSLPVRTFVGIRGGGEPLGLALSAGLLQKIADVAEADEPRLSAFLRENEQSLIDAFFTSGAMLVNSYTLPAIERPIPAIKWRAIAFYVLTGLLLIAAIWVVLRPGINVYRLQRKYLEYRNTPKGAPVCPNCARLLNDDTQATCPECAQRIKWPSRANDVRS